MSSQPPLAAAEAALRGSTGRYNHALDQLEARKRELDVAQNVYTQYYLHPTSSKTGYPSEADSALRKAQQAVDAMSGLLELYAAEVREARAAVRKLKGQGMAPASRPWDRARPPEKAKQSEEDKMRQWREQAKEQRRKEEEEAQRQKEAEEVKRRKAPGARRQQNSAKEREEREQRRNGQYPSYDHRRYFEWRAKYAHLPVSQGGANLDPKPRIPPTTLTTYESWKRSVDTAFADYGRIKTFPAPPVSNLCTKAACAAGKKLRTLEACPCDIRRTFEVLGLVAKEERLKWHPDKFSKCAEEKREIWQGMAKEVFQVLGAMYAES